MDLLPVPHDVLHDHPQGEALLLHRHVVHRAGKGLERIPQDIKRLGLEVLLLNDLLQLPDVLLDAPVPL